MSYKNILGEKIHELIFSRDVGNSKFFLGHLITEKMKVNFDVFNASMEDKISSELFGA